MIEHYARLQPKVLEWAKRYRLQPHAAQDALQDAFLILHEVMQGEHVAPEAFAEEIAKAAVRKQDTDHKHRIDYTGAVAEGRDKGYELPDAWLPDDLKHEFLAAIGDATAALGESDRMVKIVDYLLNGVEKKLKGNAGHHEKRKVNLNKPRIEAAILRAFLRRLGLVRSPLVIKDLLAVPGTKPKGV